LSYVRNLGFEDTPDYEYLRDLFTQALKNTGEVEDGEYDWMKLNNGKGWEAMKAHPSAAHLHHTGPNTSAREIHGNRASKSPVPPGRLDQELPKPGATRGAQGPTTGRHGPSRERTQQYVSADPAQAAKRRSEMGPPEGSTVAQFQQSQQNLPGNNRSQSRELLQQQMGMGNQQGGSPRAQGGQAGEEKVKWYTKIMKVLCCGKCRNQAKVLG